MSATPEPFVDIEAAAKFLGVKVSYLYEECRLGRIPSYKLGKFRRFRLSELEAVRGPGGLRIERDRFFTPTPLSRLGSPVHPRRRG